MDAEELNARYSVRNVVPAGTAVGRRRFMELLAGAGASAALLGTIDRSALAFAATTAEPSTWVPSFPDGVMSGDPSHDGSVLWTRLGAPVGETPIEVTWEVAADDGFASLVAGGSAQAVAANGYTV
jgi:phosphodiesterase/alkaline phosphatase D-like protein